MKILVLMMAWVYRYQIARFLSRAARTAAETWRRLSEEREAERARAQENAGPHGGFDPDRSSRPF